MSFRKPFKPTHKNPLGDFPFGADLSPAPLVLSAPSPKDLPEASLSSALSKVDPSAAKAAREASLQSSLDFANELELSLFGAVQDEVKEKAVVATLGKTVAAVVGVAAVPFVVADVMDVLAPGVHQWLRGGWESGSGLSPKGVSTGFDLLPGQAAGSYTVEVSWRYYADSSGSSSASSVYRQGQSGPFTINPNIPYGLRTQYSSSTFTYATSSTGFPSVAMTVGWGIVPGSFTRTFTRADGNPDTVTQSPRPDAPSPLITNPRPGSSRFFPPRNRMAATGNLPSTQTLSDLLSAAEEAYAPFFDLLDPSVPSPESQTLPESLSNPAPTTYSLPPRNPVPPFTEADSCDPCSFKIGQKLEEISDKLDEKEKDEEEPEEPSCKTYPFTYTIGTCEDGEFKTETKTLSLAEEPTDKLRAEFDSMLLQASRSCGLEPVAAIPDWWQVRIGAERPQIVVIYRRGTSATYHQISLPHPANTDKWTENELGDYRKGSYQAILTLKDNSKFIINCIDEAEALRMIARAKSLINPEMILNPSPEFVSRRRGAVVSDGNMFGRSSLYFSKGQKDAKPDWRANFSPSPAR